MENLLRVLFFCFVLSSCVTSPDDKLPLEQAILKARSTSSSLDAMSLLQRSIFLHPFSPSIASARLDNLYYIWRIADYPKLTSFAKEFITLHPNHPQLDYALYMLGLGQWNTGVSKTQAYVSTNLALRDLSEKRKAAATFARILKEFPESDFAYDSNLRLIYIRNLLAEKHLLVAQEAMKEKGWQAARENCQIILSKYPSSIHVPDAIICLVDSEKNLLQSILQNP